MSKYMSQDFDRVNALVASGLFFLVFVVYYLTKAPTVSFWDCGEFIACSSILGIPHPPGTPLYILLGRLFTLLPLADNFAARVNMLSVISSSFTALFGYLISVRLLRNWFTESGFEKFLIYAASFSGALFLAWSLTNWNNSVEAEVYGASMMLITAIFWLSLIFIERRESRWGIPILLLITYLSFLGIGIHMTTFLVMPIIFLLFVLKNKNLPAAWTLFTAFVAAELYLVFALSSRPGEVPYFVPVVIVAVCLFLYLFGQEKIERASIWVAGILMVAICPVYLVAINQYYLKTGRIEPLSDAVMNAGTVLGLIALAVSVVAGVLSYRQYKQVKIASNRNTQLLVSAAAPIVAVIMVALLFVFKGYIPFLFISAILLLLLLFKLRAQIHWAIMISVVVLLTVVVGMKLFAVALGIGLVTLLTLGLSGRLPRWKTALAMLVVGVLGFSVHLFLPIRASQQPAINESDPSESITATINYLERKQYESISMIERMFKRRGEWVNQFGDHRRMGFWRFFRHQFGNSYPAGFALFLVIGLYGLWELIRRKPEAGLILLLLILVCSIGLVLYMNFADGTGQAAGRGHLEVRDRDYFFTPAFILFGLVIGIGLAAAGKAVSKATRDSSKLTRTASLTAVSVLFLLPGYTLAENYFKSDRSNNYLAFNYAWNILQSTDQNAVLFTQGDNDTFPLWALQEAFGIRTDVRVVNLSLANAKWYVKQLQSIMGINLGWTEEQINKIRPVRTQDGRTFRIQDMVIDAILKNNYNKRPIEFSVTVPSSARKFNGYSIDKRLTMNGMTWQVGAERDKMALNVDRTYRYFTAPDKFKGEGYDDPTLFKNETSIRLTANYANGMLMAADDLQARGDLDKAEELAMKSATLVPWFNKTTETLAGIYARQGKIEKLRALVDTTTRGDRLWIVTMLGRTELFHGDTTKGEQILNGVLVNNSSYKTALDDLLRYYMKDDKFAQMKLVLQRWLQFNKNDRQAKALLDDITKREKDAQGNR